MYEATNPTDKKGISMSSLTVYAPQVTILDSVVKAINGLYCLNDLHKASGNDKKHQPSNFMRNSEVINFVDELVQTSEKGVDQVTQRINGGEMRGTYACKELVYRYAMWISPRFALLVIRTFDKLVRGELQVVPSQLSPLPIASLYQKRLICTVPRQVVFIAMYGDLCISALL